MLFGIGQTRFRCFLFLLAASVLWADVTGSISGSVKDPSGASIANASVVAINVEPASNEPCKPMQTAPIQFWPYKLAVID